MARPRPDPGRPRAAGARQKRSNAAPASPAARPGPASPTDTRAPAVAGAHGDRHRRRAVHERVGDAGCRARGAARPRRRAPRRASGASAVTSRVVARRRPRGPGRRGRRARGAAPAWSLRSSASRSSTSRATRSTPRWTSAIVSASAPWRAMWSTLPAQGRQRRAQLVRGVGEEPALALAGALERREHRVERVGELADLAAASAGRQTVGRVAAALDAARGDGQAPQRREAAARSAPPRAARRAARPRTR